MNKFFVSLIIFLMFPLSAGAVTGNEYRKLSEVQRLAWTVGVTDGILTTHVIDSKKVSPLVECFGKLEREQIQAIFEKALESRPESWHFPAAFTCYTTFKQYCYLETK